VPICILLIPASLMSNAALSINVFEMCSQFLQLSLLRGMKDTNPVKAWLAFFFCDTGA
jgi:hypothetical protein